MVHVLWQCISGGSYIHLIYLEIENIRERLSGLLLGKWDLGYLGNSIGVKIRSVQGIRDLGVLV